MTTPCILLVDDEPNILAALERTFRGEGYELLCAANAEEALNVVETNLPDVVVSDHRLPGMTGVRLLERVRERCPRAIRILLTGVADLEAATQAINRSQVYRFVAKPWNNDDLRATVRQALRQKEIEEQNADLLATVHGQNEKLRDLNANLEELVHERTAEVHELYSRLRSQFVQSVKVFVELTSLRNANIAEHSKRVAEFSRVIASHLGLDQEEVFRIEVAAVLHDIGKLGMPRSIVEWPTQTLTDDEQALLQEHPVRAQELVKHVTFFEPVGRIVRHHHERYAGLGYPDGLKEKEIPLGSRLIAIADAFDRARYSRKYGRQMSQDDALDMIEQLGGREFDPDLVALVVPFLRRRNTPAAQWNNERQQSLVRDDANTPSP
jgi:putative nucleotidyltransferase with HDIG domain